MGSDSHGDFKANEAEFFNNFKRNEHNQVIVHGNPNYKTSVPPKIPLSLRVWSWWGKVVESFRQAFWWLYDGITSVFWCGELNRLYDEIASLRAERDEAMFRLQIAESIIKLHESERKFKTETNTACADSEAFDPWQGFSSPAKPAKRRRVKKKPARRKKS